MKIHPVDDLNAAVRTDDRDRIAFSQAHLGLAARLDPDALHDG
jgi:hypothetical protein